MLGTVELQNALLRPPTADDGSATPLGVRQQLIYVPDLHAHGEDVFEYQATDCPVSRAELESTLRCYTPVTWRLRSPAGPRRTDRSRGFSFEPSRMPREWQGNRFRLSSSAAVAINIHPVNDGPTAHPLADVTVTLGESATFTVPVSDIDNAVSSLQVTIIQAPPFGELRPLVGNGTLQVRRPSRTTVSTVNCYGRLRRHPPRFAWAVPPRPHPLA